MNAEVDRRVDSKAVLRAYVHDRLAREAKLAGRGYKTAVAKGTGASQPHIGNVIKRRLNIGMDLADGLAKFWNMADAAELMATAKAWADAHPELVETPAPLPNLEAAVEFLRGRGTAVPEADIEEARRAGRAARDYSEAAWMMLLGEMAQARGRGDKKTPGSSGRRSPPRSST